MQISFRFRVRADESLYAFILLITKGCIMAIKTPTPPTPPTPPVSPKAQDNEASGHNPDTATGTDGGSREFGIHINISGPEDKQEQKENTQVNSPAAGDGQLQREVTSKERDQLPEPQAVLTGDMPSDKMLQTETREPTNDTLHISHDNPSMEGISLWPFVLVFVAAFIGFTMLNYMKNKSSEPWTAQKTELPPRVGREQGKGHEPNSEGVSSKDKQEDTHKHFEIRI
jgi:hypothetical protein